MSTFVRPNKNGPTPADWGRAKWEETADANPFNGCDVLRRHHHFDGLHHPGDHRRLLLHYFAAALRLRRRMSAARSEAPTAGARYSAR
jgi:hypothetical protein